MRRGVLILLLLVLIIPSNVFASERIDINIPSKTLQLYIDDNFVKAYPVAVGKPSSDSPMGHYKVKNKIVNPTWLPIGKSPVPPGPWNPLGTRWIGFYSLYGIHGNNKPESIGTFASKGCIRMFNFDVEELFTKVNVGTDINIYYNTMVPVYNDGKENPALLVYPDLYGRGTLTLKGIKDQLEQLNIDMSEDRAQKLFDKVKGGHPAVFSDNWSLFINNEYITSDSILKKVIKPQMKIKTWVDESDYVTGDSKFENVLINMEKLQNYLGMEFNQKYGVIYLGNKEIGSQRYNTKNFISLKDVSDVMGIEPLIDDTEKRIDLNLSYGIIDGDFIALDARHYNNKAYISMNDIITLFNIKDYSVNKNRTEILMGSNKLKIVNIDKNEYVDFNNAKEVLKFNGQYYSLSNKIEVSGLKGLANK